VARAAEGLAAELPDGACQVWFALTRGACLEPRRRGRDAEAAIAAGRRHRDRISRREGIALPPDSPWSTAATSRRVVRLDEAMAAATGGEVTDAAVFGDVCCLVTRAAEDAGDVSRLMHGTRS
jgi:hypothetical protein